MEKWALAMEGGSLRCMFSAGAVDVMMERQLWANGVFGVSAGALTGVNYVSRQVGRTAQVNLDFVNDKRYLGLGNLIFKKSIFNFDFLFGEISDSLLPLDREEFARYGNLYFCGRLAEYRYYNMDSAVDAALRLSAELVK